MRFDGVVKAFRKLLEELDRASLRRSKTLLGLVSLLQNFVLQVENVSSTVAALLKVGPKLGMLGLDVTLDGAGRSN